MTIFVLKIHCCHIMSSCDKRVDWQSEISAGLRQMCVCFYSTLDHVDTNVALCSVSSVAAASQDILYCHSNYRSWPRRCLTHHVWICCCLWRRCGYGEVAWAGWSQRVRSVSRSASNSRQLWPGVLVRVTSSCPTTSSLWRRSRILSGAPERCTVRRYLHRSEHCHVLFG